MNDGRKGIFIVLDGNDGSGKATQSRLLAEYLAAQGIPSEKMDFPRYGVGVFGNLVGDALAGKLGDFVHLDPHIASTLYALDRLEATPAIETALAEGKVVIADRFSSSNQIHQGGKIADETERKTFLGWLDTMEHETLKVPRPDVLIYLNVPLEISLELLSQKRAAKNGHLGAGEKDTVEADSEYLERSHATAKWIAEREPNWNTIECVVNGKLRSPEDIHADVVRIFEQARTMSETN
jgi:dTMP kinase